MKPPDDELDDALRQAHDALVALAELLDLDAGLADALHRGAEQARGDETQ